MVADLVKYIEDVISPTNNCVDLLGHSMGGKVSFFKVNSNVCYNILGSRGFGIAQ
jgi:surfactin synthase thioesterase subunit